MPHISTKKLDEEYYLKLYIQLVKIFDSAGQSKKSILLFKDFFTETEKIMFTKRLAIICLLEEGVSRPYISEMLLVSPSTVDRISLLYEIGQYKHITEILKKYNRTIWEILEGIIRDSVSKQVGKRRMAWLTEIENKHKTKIF